MVINFKGGLKRHSCHCQSFQKALHSASTTETSTATCSIDLLSARLLWMLRLDFTIQSKTILSLLEVVDGQSYADTMTIRVCLSFYCSSKCRDECMYETLSCPGNTGMVHQQNLSFWSSDLKVWNTLLQDKPHLAEGCTRSHRCILDHDVPLAEVACYWLLTCSHQNVVWRWSQAWQQICHLQQAGMVCL